MKRTTINSSVACLFFKWSTQSRVFVLYLEFSQDPAKCDFTLIVLSPSASPLFMKGHVFESKAFKIHAIHTWFELLTTPYKNNYDSEA